MKTVIGSYSTVAAANAAKSALQAQGYEAGQISVMDQTYSQGESATSSESLGDKIKGFFTSFSDHDDDHAGYSGHLSSGGAMVAVKVVDEDADHAAMVLKQQGATDIEGAATTREDTYAGDVSASGATLANTDTTVAGEQVIPIVQEDMQVGKREVERGGVRVYTHTVTTPVSADVTLREEHVVVARRPVSREATAADFDTNGKVIELRETAEEAVIGKTSRVVEEVLVGKQATEHTQQINDTVRHTEVEVEPVTTTGTTTTTNYNR